MNAISAYFEKKVQEVEKNTPIKVYQDIFFFEKCIIWEIRDILDLFYI